MLTQDYVASLITRWAPRLSTLSIFALTKLKSQKCFPICCQLLPPIHQSFNYVLCKRQLMPFLMMNIYMLQQGLLCGLLLRRFVALWSFLLTGFLILIWSWLHIPCTKFALLVHHIVCYVHSEILSLMKSRPKSRLLAYDVTLQFEIDVDELAKVPADMYGF